MAGKPRKVPTKPVKKGGHSFLKGPKQAAVKEVKGVKLISVKNQIRGVQRLLNKDTLDAKIRRNLEAKLAQLQENQAKHNQVETERKFAVRYHKIRFFERVKLERRINQIENKQVRGHALSAQEQQQLTEAKADLQYVMHFPKGERYVSILKDAAEPEAQAALVAERARLRKLVRHQMAETAMIADADEGFGQNADEAAPTADAEADAFFLEDEVAEALQEPSAGALRTSPLFSGHDAPAERPSGKDAQDKVAIQQRPVLLPMSPHQKQQQQQLQQKQQQQRQQQSQQQQHKKRKREPDAPNPDKLDVKAVQSLPGSVAEHHALHYAHFQNSDMPGLTADPAGNSKASQSLTADMSHPQHAPASNLIVAARQHTDDTSKTQLRLRNQVAQQQGHAGDGQISKGLTPAERSRLLLTKLRQKHGKRESLQPVKAGLQVDIQDAVRSHRPASHTTPAAEPQQLRVLSTRPADTCMLPSKANPRTAKFQPVKSKQHTKGSAPVQSNVERSQAVKAPTRSRAEGGRKRRR